MLLPTFLSASALALTANAFLVPLEVDKEQTSPFDPTSFAQQSQTINVDCSSCPYAVAKGPEGTVWKQDVPSDLEMEFTAEGNSLKLNGVPFFPLSKAPLPPIISVKQIPKDGAEDVAQEPVRLSYSLEFEQENPIYVKALMTIMGLEMQMVRIDNIEIKALRAPGSNELKLLSVTAQTPSPTAPDAKCTNIMCRVGTKLAAKIHAAAKKVKHVCLKCLQRLQAFKHHHAAKLPTPPSMPEAPKTPSVPDVPEGVKLPTHHHFRMGHGHQRHHGFMHKMAHGIKKAFAFVILPILIGIAFGLAASAVGMLVGQVVVFLWLRRRRNNAQYEVVATEEGVEGLPKYEEVAAAETEDEKAGLVEKV